MGVAYGEIRLQVQSYILEGRNCDKETDRGQESTAFRKQISFPLLGLSIFHSLCRAQSAPRCTAHRVASTCLSAAAVASTCLRAIQCLTALVPCSTPQRLKALTTPT